MSQPDSYRVQYGVSPSRSTSFWPWLLGVTVILAGIGGYVATQGFFGGAPAAETPDPLPAPRPVEGVLLPESQTPTLPMGVEVPEVGAQIELMTYFPLGEDYRWDFRQTVTHLGQETEAGERVSFQVEAIERVEGRQVYRCNLAHVELFYSVQGNDLMVSKTVDSPGMIQLRAPLEHHAVWESPEGQMRYQVGRDNIEVTVPAGTFECLEIEKTALDGTKVKETLYYAPGVGLVQQITQLGVGEKRTWSLESYVIQGEAVGNPSTHPTS